jgi:hypothetical protein
MAAVYPAVDGPIGFEAAPASAPAAAPLTGNKVINDASQVVGAHAERCCWAVHADPCMFDPARLTMHV